jgi:protein phosphatase
MSQDLVLNAYGLTDVGQKRESNEDVVLVRPDLELYAVADGAGGHRSGEIASALAARSLENYFGATVRRTHEQPEFDAFGIPSGARRLSAAILKANRDVIEIAKSSPEHKGMGTTLVAACFSPRSGLMHVGHAGDSRCYRLRGGHLEQLTQDHSLLTDVLEQRPELDDSVLERLPKSVVTRALGLDARLRISLRSHAVVAARADAESVAKELVRRANLAGGRDNISALVVDCTHGPETKSVPPPAPGSTATLRGAEGASDPELLILGIEELDSLDAHSASDDLLKALEGLLGKRP